VSGSVVCGRTHSVRQIRLERIWTPKAAPSAARGEAHGCAEQSHPLRQKCKRPVWAFCVSEATVAIQGTGCGRCQRLHPSSRRRLPICRSVAERRWLLRTSSRTSSQWKRRAMA